MKHILRSGREEDYRVPSPSVPTEVILRNGFEWAEELVRWDSANPANSRVVTSNDPCTWQGDSDEDVVVGVPAGFVGAIVCVRYEHHTPMPAVAKRIGLPEGPVDGIWSPYGERFATAGKAVEYLGYWSQNRLATPEEVAKFEAAAKAEALRAETARRAAELRQRVAAERREFLANRPARPAVAMNPLADAFGQAGL